MRLKALNVRVISEDAMIDCLISIFQCLVTCIESAPWRIIHAHISSFVLRVFSMLGYE